MSYGYGACTGKINNLLIDKCYTFQDTGSGPKSRTYRTYLATRKRSAKQQDRMRGRVKDLGAYWKPDAKKAKELWTELGRWGSMSDRRIFDASRFPNDRFAQGTHHRLYMSYRAYADRAAKGKAAWKRQRDINATLPKLSAGSAEEVEATPASGGGMVLVTQRTTPMGIDPVGGGTTSGETPEDHEEEEILETEIVEDLPIAIVEEADAEMISPEPEEATGLTQSAMFFYGKYKIPIWVIALGAVGYYGYNRWVK